MTTSRHRDLLDWLADVPARAIACSGGVDSMLLATIAHRADPAATLVVHDVTPAVPAMAVARVLTHAHSERWRLQVVRSAAFDDERYLANPANRCYFCKTHLYDTMTEVSTQTTGAQAQLLSGANVDDLSEYRPGLIAADEHQVRHPFVEIGFGKHEIRVLARQLDLSFADLPASPCLASRVYTGTRVTAARLKAIDVGEELLRHRTTVAVLRCRVAESAVLVEVCPDDFDRVTRADLDAALAAMRFIEPTLSRIELDSRGYRPGRAFVLHDRSAVGAGHQ